MKSLIKIIIQFDYLLLAFDILVFDDFILYNYVIADAGSIVDASLIATSRVTI